MGRIKFAIPEDFFDFDDARPADWPDNPEVRRAVEWFRGRLPAEDWRKRRLAAAQRLYELVLNGSEPGSSGRFFEPRDSFAWYLFLAESYIDHIWNYDPVFGSRVVPVFASIGRNLELLNGVDGIDGRVNRMINAERSQPNGPLFELLVAAAYRRAGAQVQFVPERRGGLRSHDLDVALSGRDYAVECKRMETSDFGDAERMRVRQLWGPSAAHLGKILQSTFAQVDFLVPVAAIPDNYLTNVTKRWQRAPTTPFEWEDRFGRGRIAVLDLEPLREVLRNDIVLAGSTRILELLTGRYKRHQSVVSALRIKPADNPRYADDCDYATLLEWNPLSDASILGRARDVLRKVVDGNDQLPPDRAGIIHVGFEAVEGDRVESVRHARITESMRNFDPGSKPLEYVYTHFLAPESPPDQSWAYDETTDTRAIRPKGPPPLDRPFLVIPDNSTQRQGGHWQ